ncbi:hypothetical protein CRUP_035713 [Coryphaenoides rupestris]|nr:hypothetical protein CRUP_035713 [Coryphaenoides rupestris]
MSSPWGDTDTLGGLGGFGSEIHSSQTSKTTLCGKSTRTIVTQTPSGPVETTEEVIEGGPACQTMMDSTKGMPFIFPTLERSKGLLDTKTGFLETGFDLGGFIGDNPEDDHPDVHARSMKSTTVNTKTASYVGKDCADILQHHTRGEVSGVFEVHLGQGPDTRVVQVYCDQSGFMGGWLLVQQRESGQLNFNRSWVEYRQGFGSVDAQGQGELWLGNRQLHLLTNRSESMLRVELEDWEGGVATAQYSIKVASEREGFRLRWRNYEAGDGGGWPGVPQWKGWFRQLPTRDQEGCGGARRGRVVATPVSGNQPQRALRPRGGPAERRSGLGGLTGQPTTA